MARTVTCPVCGGATWLPSLPEGKSDCPTCRGSGKVPDVALPRITAARPAPKPEKPKRLSRAQRWADAASKAKEGLEELQAIQDEFEEWRDNFPENAQGGATYEKLEAVCDLDIDSAVETVEEAEQIDLPQGFGRD